MSIDEKAFKKAQAAWNNWMSEPNEGIEGGLRAAIEAYEAAKETPLVHTQDKHSIEYVGQPVSVSLRRSAEAAQALYGKHMPKNTVAVYSWCEDIAKAVLDAAKEQGARFEYE